MIRVQSRVRQGKSTFEKRTQSNQADAKSKLWGKLPSSCMVNTNSLNT